MMKTLITVITLLLLVPVFLNAQQTLNETMVHNSVTRDYIVYVPATYSENSAVPLMFNFHGYTMTANDQMTWGGDMRSVADTAGFILVYPQGTLLGGSTHWNVGSWTSFSTADDIGFTEAMIDSISANYNIDLSRVYSCGYSNGGYFSFELACQLSGQIAAIGSVGGTMSSETYAACNPSHPTPVVTIHGTSDAVVSYNGGNPFNSESLLNVNSYWSGYNNIFSAPVVTDIPDISSFDGSTVEKSVYNDGDNCVSMEHYKVIGGGHDWPGSWGNMDINASSVIWDFVSKYDIDGLIGCGFTSVNDENTLRNKTSIYPNPTNGFVTLKTEIIKSQEYEIYSITGELLLNGTIEINEKTIDLSVVPKGVLVLKIGKQTLKLVKTD